MSQHIITALIAAVVALVVASVDYWGKDREMEVKMVEIAVGILRAKPEDNIRPAREWAVDVISRYSRVPISPETRKALLEHELLVGEWYDIGKVDYGYDSGNKRDDKKTKKEK